MPSTTLRPTFAVVIPAYNEEALLPRTLARLNAALTALGRSADVVVVDNNSTDRTAEVARAAGARVVHEPVNQISRARNAGARSTSAPFLIFLDADTEPTAELLEAALTRLGSGRFAGGGAFIELSGSPLPRLTRLVLDSLSWILVKVGICGGSFIFCTRESFDGVGGFSEKVYAAEDALLSLALRRWGRRRGQRFEIFARPTIRSSDRKLKTHSPVFLLFTLLMFGLFPFAVRFKSFCRLWYERRPN
jgi:glycosyltransferase involved in cell wall biosynthesis